MFGVLEDRRERSAQRLNIKDFSRFKNKYLIIIKDWGEGGAPKWELRIDWAR